MTSCAEQIPLTYNPPAGRLTRVETCTLPPQPYALPVRALLVWLSLSTPPGTDGRAWIPQAALRSCVGSA